jgi:hypothetical protein
MYVAGCCGDGGELLEVLGGEAGVELGYLHEGLTLAV